MAHYAEIQGFVKGHGAARGDQLHGACITDQARQALRAAHARLQPQVHLRQSDPTGVPLGNADIAGQGQLQTSAHGVSVESGDHQFGGHLQPPGGLIRVKREVIEVVG